MYSQTINNALRIDIYEAKLLKLLLTTTSF